MEVADVGTKASVATEKEQKQIACLGYIRVITYIPLVFGSQIRIGFCKTFVS